VKWAFEPMPQLRRILTHREGTFGDVLHRREQGINSPRQRVFRILLFLWALVAEKPALLAGYRKQF